MSIKEKALKSIKDYNTKLTQNGFTCSIFEEKQYNFEFTALKNKNKNKLLVYFGKKGIRTIIQGNNNSKEYNELSSIISGIFSLQFEESPELNYDEYIGTDETGKGDFFGPLVVAGFYVNKDSQIFLADLGVRDSKELTDIQINNMARQIKKKYPNNFSIIAINPKKYNQLYLEFNNVNRLLDWAHSKVIENVYKDFKPKNIIVDQFSKTPLKISLTAGFSAVNFVQIPKAEKYIGVAAASILARSEMNRWFAKKQKEGYFVLKGASKEVENAANIIYKKIGREKLTALIKLHFKTSKRIFEN